MTNEEQPRDEFRPTVAQRLAALEGVIGPEKFREADGYEGDDPEVAQLAALIRSVRDEEGQ